MVRKSQSCRPKPKKEKKPFRLEAKIVAKLRQISRYWPAKNEVITAAKMTDGKLFQCKSCNHRFRREYIRADHIDPVGKAPRKGDPARPSWDEYIERMFCPASNFQVLCLDCHDKKTKIDTEKMKNV